VDVDALVSGGEDPHRGLGILGDAPLVPPADVLEHRATQRPIVPPKIAEFRSFLDCMAVAKKYAYAS
jgi:hypothetical protein